MAQGKFKKTKTTVPNKKKKVGSTAFKRRSNAPVPRNAAKSTANQKIKDVVSKTVNKAVESELRSRAVGK